MRVTFWGVRGTLPVPGEKTLRFGGNTPCIGIEAGGRQIVLDAGSGISLLGSEMKRRIRNSVADVDGHKALILFGHTHNDHLMGFPFFDPILNSDFHIYIFGPDSRQAKFSEILESTVRPPVFPITIKDFHAHLQVRSLYTRGCILWPAGGIPRMLRKQPETVHPSDVLVEWYRSITHPTEGVCFHKIRFNGRTMVYASDTESGPNGDPELARFARSADLLIHDTTYLTEDYEARKGWGHSTYEFAAATAKLAGVKRLAMFHYDPRYDDAMLDIMVRRARKVFHGIIASRDGMRISL